MTDENKNLVKEIFSQLNVEATPTSATNNSLILGDQLVSVMEELDQKEANEILVRSSPMEVSQLNVYLGATVGVIIIGMANYHSRQRSFIRLPGVQEDHSWVI